MRIRLFFCLLAVILGIACGSGTEAIAGGPYPSGRSFQLLNENVGWRLTRGGPFRTTGRLWWTTDGGGRWKDITPPFPRELNQLWAGEREVSKGIGAVFFLDTNRGWVLFDAYQIDDPPQGLHLAIASTADAGATWSVTPVWEPPAGELPGPIGFADAMHGWIDPAVLTHNGWEFGALFTTSDGGRTWRGAISNPDAGGDFVMLSPTEGWLRGGFVGNEVYVTRDGARSWRLLELKAPRQIYPATEPTYELPTFVDRKHGFEAVTYSDPPGEKSAVVLFRTADGGRTWKPDRMLTGLEALSQRRGFESAVVGPNWLVFIPHRAHIAAAGRFPERPERPARMMKIGPGEKVAASGAAASVSSAGTWSTIFATADRGWGLAGKGELVATTDGGNTWTRIEPTVEVSEAAERLSVHRAPGAPPEGLPPPAGKAALQPPQLYPGDVNKLPPGLQRRFMPPSATPPSDQPGPP